MIYARVGAGGRIPRILIGEKYRTLTSPPFTFPTMALDASELLATVGDYKPGSIRRIVLKNFLTYENAVITPGSR